MDEMINKAADDLVRAGHAVALTGAGISTESGVLDFRGPDGLWTKNPELGKKGLSDLPYFPERSDSLLDRNIG